MPVFGDFASISPANMREIVWGIERELHRRGWSNDYVGERYLYQVWTHPDHPNADRPDNGWSLDAALSFEQDKAAARPLTESYRVY